MYSEKAHIIGSYLLSNIRTIKTTYNYALMVSIPALLLEEVTQWTMENQTYIKIVLLTVFIDLIFGNIVHFFYKNDWNILKNLTGLILKIAVVVLVGILFENLSFMVRQEELIFQYLRMSTRMLVIVYPMRSALMNCSIVTGGVFPPSIVFMKFARFNKSMDISDFKPKFEDKAAETKPKKAKK